MAVKDPSAKISRYRVKRAKIEYWRERDKLGKLNEMIADVEKRYGSRAKAQGREDYMRLLSYRTSLIGKLEGVKSVFDMFKLSLDKEDAPIIYDSDIYGEQSEEEVEEEMEAKQGEA